MEMERDRKREIERVSERVRTEMSVKVKRKCCKLASPGCVVRGNFCG